jgi:hypothetical protein
MHSFPQPPPASGLPFQAGAYPVSTGTNLSSQGEIVQTSLNALQHTASGMILPGGTVTPNVPGAHDVASDSVPGVNKNVAAFLSYGKKLLQMPMAAGVITDAITAEGSQDYVTSEGSPSGNSVYSNTMQQGRAAIPGAGVRQSTPLQASGETTGISVTNLKFNPQVSNLQVPGGAAGNIVTNPNFNVQVSTIQHGNMSPAELSEGVTHSGGSTPRVPHRDPVGTRIFNEVKKKVTGKTVTSDVRNMFSGNMTTNSGTRNVPMFHPPLHQPSPRQQALEEQQ